MAGRKGRVSASRKNAAVETAVAEKSAAVETAAVEKKEAPVKEVEASVKTEEKTTGVADVVEAVEAVAETVAEAVAETKKRTRRVAAKKTEEAPAEPKKRGPKPKTAEEKAEAVKENVVLQFTFGEYSVEDVVEQCKKAYTAENKAKIKNIDVYVKPADKRAYYVVNDKVAGSIEL